MLQGTARTLELLRRRCYWPRMYIDTHNYCLACPRCQGAKSPQVKFSQSTGHIIAAAPLEIVAMDFAKLEPETDGREDVLVCTDVFTKWTIAVPTRDQTARTVAKVLIEEWIPHYGEGFTQTKEKVLMPRSSDVYVNATPSSEAERLHTSPKAVVCASALTALCMTC